MAKTPPAEPPFVPIVDDLHAPTIYADMIAGGAPGAPDCQVATLTFAVAQWDHSEIPPRAYGKTVLRLKMPIEAMRKAVAFAERMMTNPPGAEIRDSEMIIPRGRMQ